MMKTPRRAPQTPARPVASSKAPDKPLSVPPEQLVCEAPMSVDTPMLEAVAAEEALMRAQQEEEEAIWRAQQEEEARRQQEAERAAYEAAMREEEERRRRDEAERREAEQRAMRDRRDADDLSWGFGGGGSQGQEDDGRSWADTASILPRMAGMERIAGGGPSRLARAAKPLGWLMGGYNTVEGTRRMMDGENHNGDGMLQATQGLAGLAGASGNPYGTALATGLAVGRAGDERLGMSERISDMGQQTYETVGGGFWGHAAAGGIMAAGSVASIPAVAGAGIYDIGEDMVGAGSDLIDWALD